MIESMIDETSLLVSPSIVPLGHRKKNVQLYLGLLASLFSFPLASSQLVIYDLLFEVVCGSKKIPDDLCSTDPIAAGSVADILSSVSILNGVISTVVMVVLSALSDRVGRKYGLLWFMFFTTLGTAVYPLLAYGIPSGYTHWRILVPYIFLAIGGTPTLMLNMSVLFITDSIPEPKVRTQYLSFFLGILMLVQAVAPGVGSAVFRGSGMSISTYLSICALWMALGAFICFLAIKEPTKEPTSSHRENEAVEPMTFGFKSTIRKSLQTLSFSHCETQLQRRNALLLLLNFFFSNEFAVGFLDLIIVYAKHKFGWVAATIGQKVFYMFSVRTAWALIGFPLLYAQLTKLWPAKPNDVDRADLVHMTLCNILTFAGYMLLTHAKTSAQYTGGTIVIANDGIAGPIWINALLKHVPENQRGEFMAAISLVNKPAGAFFPAALMKVFQLTIDTHANLVFYLVSAMALLLTFSLFWLKPTHN